MIELTTNFFCLTRTQRTQGSGRPLGRDYYSRRGEAGAASRRRALTQSLERRGRRGRRLHTRPAEGAEAAELRPRYNWSLAWSLSASGLTVWPGEGAWGGWDTGGRPWDRDMALGTMPSTAAGMPLGATPTTPGGYLLGEEGGQVRLAVGGPWARPRPVAVALSAAGRAGAAEGTPPWPRRPLPQTLTPAPSVTSILMVCRPPGPEGYNLVVVTPRP